MKLIKTEDAVGCMLCHDITQIIPGVVKDAVFRKGHVVTREDIPVLLPLEKSICMCGKNKKGCFMKMRRQRSCAACARMHRWMRQSQKEGKNRADGTV